MSLNEERVAVECSQGSMSRKRVHGPGSTGLPLADLIATAMEGESLTLDQVARRVRREAEREKDSSRATVQLVSKWRAGQVTPGPNHLRWLARALDLPIGLVAASARAQEQAKASTALPAMVTTADRTRIPLGITTPGPDNAPAGQDYVAYLRDSVQRMVVIDSQFGPDGLAEVVTRFAASATRRLTPGSYEPSIQRDLRAAVAEVFEYAGWVLFDADRPLAAMHYTQEALALARLSGDQVMQHLVLHNMSMIAERLRQSRQALRIDRYLLGDGWTRRLTSLYRVREARALAQLGDVTGVDQACDEARSLYLDGATAADPHWAWWIDEAQLAIHDGLAHAEVGHWHRAVEMLSRGTFDCPASRAAARHYIRGQLLNALIVIESWHDVSLVIDQATASVTEFTSRRIANLMHTAIARANAASGAPTTVVEAAHHLRDVLRDSGYAEDLLDTTRFGLDEPPLVLSAGEDEGGSMGSSSGRR
jgi:transcriptional regulator with XRE-family HTH domain